MGEGQHETQENTRHKANDAREQEAEAQHNRSVESSTVTPQSACDKLGNPATGVKQVRTESSYHNGEQRNPVVECAGMSARVEVVKQAKHEQAAEADDEHDAVVCDAPKFPPGDDGAPVSRLVRNREQAAIENLHAARLII